MSGSMGRKRQANYSLPPRMHMKGKTYYYVTSSLPRKWIKLDSDLAKAKVLWAQLEGEQGSEGTFCKALDEWMAGARFNSLSAASKLAYTKSSVALRVFFSGADLGNIKPHNIAAWLDNHPSPAMANIGRALLSNVMNHAVRNGVIDRNPCKDMAGLVIKSRTRYMTDAEFIAIREQANPLIRCCMDISYLTGMRASDVLKIQLADIKPDGLYVTQQKTDKKQRFDMTESLSLVLDAARALPRCVRNITHLFCSRNGVPYKYSVLNTGFFEAKRKAKITDVRFHDIRAKAATDGKHQGLDYQALLGHTSKAMSDKYIRRFEFESVAPLKNVL